MPALRKLSGSSANWKDGRIVHWLYKKTSGFVETPSVLVD
jgi:hypothetical protein